MTGFAASLAAAVPAAAGPAARAARAFVRWSLVAASLGACAGTGAGAGPEPSVVHDDAGGAGPIPLDAATRAHVARITPPTGGERTIAAYAARIETEGTDRARPIHVLGRQAPSGNGLLVVVTRTEGDGAWGMTRASSLCGLVALHLHTVLVDRAYRLADPASGDGDRFTDEARLAPDIRMRAELRSLDGDPCAPRAGGSFSVQLETRSTVRDQPRASSAARIRYDCRAAAATEPASRLHPALPGSMLAVACDRHATVDGRSGTAGASTAPTGGGRIRYAWIADSGAYLVVAHEGVAAMQRHVYTDIVLR